MSKRNNWIVVVLIAVVAAVAAFFLWGCAAVGDLRPAPAYVAADRATYEAVSPVVRALADTDPTNDPDLSGVNGAAMLQMLDNWNRRIESAEFKSDGQ